MATKRRNFYSRKVLLFNGLAKNGLSTIRRDASPEVSNRKRCMKNVEIYGKPNCNFCRKAVGVCKSYAIDYKYYELDKDYELKDLWAKVRFATYPQIFVDGKPLGGYTEFSSYVLGYTR